MFTRISAATKYGLLEFSSTSMRTASPSRERARNLLPAWSVSPPPQSASIATVNVTAGSLLSAFFWRAAFTRLAIPLPPASAPRPMAQPPSNFLRHCDHHLVEAQVAHLRPLTSAVLTQSY